MSDRDHEEDENGNDGPAPVDGEEIGDGWVAYKDEEGQVYYYNAESGETQWDRPGAGDGDRDTIPPGLGDDGDINKEPSYGPVAVSKDKAAGAGGSDAGVNEEVVGAALTPPLDGEDDKEMFPKSSVARATSDATDLRNKHDPVSQSPPMTMDHEENADKGEVSNEAVADGDEIGNGWVAYKDEEGQVYYYNADSGETQWDRPDVGETPAAEDTNEASTSPPPVSPGGKKSTCSKVSSKEKSDDHVKKMDIVADTDKPACPKIEEPEQENTVDTAEQFLNRPDAVMEPSVLDHINNLVQELGPQVAGPKAMSALVNGYGGDTAVCGLMGLWLAELKGATTGEKGLAAMDTGNNGTINDYEVVGANAARDAVEEVVSSLTKERFTKDHGDAIVNLSKKDAAFIEKMIKSQRWRKLLIDMSAMATNKDSRLFMYCLQSISNLGHHRDIVNRINQSDYFEVFDSMLKSELCIAAQIGVDGSVECTIGGGTGPIMMGSLIADLRRTCTATSYTYLYANQVLNQLISKSTKLISPSNHGRNGNLEVASLKQAIRKWERLREELEDEMIKPLAKGTAFQRKRRIDVALTMNDLFQRKRRRMDPRGDNNAIKDHHLNNSSLENLDSALSQLLTKNSLGVQIDKEIVDNILKFAYGGSTDRIGDLLIQHPSAVIALLHTLFGSKRIKQLETRLKVSRLLALAVMASKRNSGANHNENADDVADESIDEDNISQVVLKGSQLCEQLENMVSFTVLDSAEISTEDGSSIGRQLSALCMQHAVVAQGFLIWAKERATGSEFASTVSYPTISPCILSLARLICRHHPMTRPAVLDLSLIFVGHSNREISHQKMQSIKEQCLRLMLCLMTQGLSLMVLSAVQSNLETSGGSSGSSEMDSALVRYFFSGILDIIRPPLSLTFVRALGGLMLKRPFVDALQGSQLCQQDLKQDQIAKLLDQFKAAATGHVQKLVCWEGDESLLLRLKSTYCVSNNNKLTPA